MFTWDWGNFERKVTFLKINVEPKHWEGKLV